MAVPDPGPRFASYTGGRRLAVVSGLLCSLIAFALDSDAAAPDSATAIQATPRVVVTLAADPSGVLTASVDAQAKLAWPKLRDTGAQTLNGIQFSTGADDSSFVLRSVEKEAVIQAEAFSGWAAKIPRGSQATLRLDTKHRLLDLRTPAGNPEPVTVRFADDARAEIKGGSVTRFDLLDDGSYTFSGRGNVYAIDNAGLPVTLSPDQPPLTGGPLVETTESAGTVRRAWLTPVTTLSVSGELGAELTVKAGDQTAQVPANSRKTIRLGNGSIIEIKQNAAAQTLEWRVEKGHFRFQIEGMNCWHPIGLTGQTAALQWNLSTKMADLHNLSADQDVLVDLAIRYFADVAPKAVFQYAQFNDCTTFAVSAAGGRVMLCNAQSGREYPLDLDSFSVNAGVPEQDATGPARLAATPRKTILLSGESGAQFQVQGSLGSAVIAPNSQKTLQGAGASQVQLNYDDGGRLTLRATSGDFMILAGNVSFSLNQGDAVTLSGNPAGGQITVQTPAGNITPVLLTAGGQGVNFGPNSQGTIKTGVDTGLTVANVSGNVTPASPPPNEVAAANVNRPRTPPPTPPASTSTAQIDGSRIQQLPVSPSQ